MLQFRLSSTQTDRQDGGSPGRCGKRRDGGSRKEGEGGGILAWQCFCLVIAMVLFVFVALCISALPPLLESCSGVTENGLRLLQSFRFPYNACFCIIVGTFRDLFTTFPELASGLPWDLLALFVPNGSPCKQEFLIFCERQAREHAPGGLKICSNVTYQPF